MSPVPASTKRVAAVQLAYYPAGLFQRRSPREDPLFDPSQPGDSLLPARDPDTAVLREELRALRQRIRQAHDAQLLAKARAILETCRSWSVDLVLFPEYSLPWNLLSEVAEAAGDMVVVAGTHTVDWPALNSGIYEQLHAPALPEAGQAVCPVLHRGRLLALQPKLNPSTAELDTMRPGTAWIPVPLEGFPQPVGILICLDFLFERSPAFQQWVAPKLEECGLLLVPSLTPHYTLPEFDAKAGVEARRYKRPVLYCDGASGGGTSLYLDKKPPTDLRQFPREVGYLETGDEGVIVTELRLGAMHSGKSTSYDARQDVTATPVAAATLVYRTDPAGRAYAQWLEETASLLASADPASTRELLRRIQDQEQLLLDAGAQPGAKARGRRLRRLVDDVLNNRVLHCEEVRPFMREILLSAQVLPPSALRAALAEGSADAVWGWLQRSEVRAVGFGEVEVRLRKEAESLGRAQKWTPEALKVISEVATEVRGPVERTGAAEAPPSEQEVLKPGIRKHGGWVLSFAKEPGDFRPRWGESRWDEAPGSGTKPAHQRTSSPDEEARRRDGPGPLTEAQIESAEQLFSLAIAEEADRAVAVAVWREKAPDRPVLWVVSCKQGQWSLWTQGHEGWKKSDVKSLQEAFRAQGLAVTELQTVPQEQLSARVQALLPRFEGARGVISVLRERRLQEVQGQFVEPDARVDDGMPQRVLKALEDWWGSTAQAALLLGEFGSGKSTALAEWAERSWRGVAPARILLADLAGTAADRSAEQILLEAAGLEDGEAHRAALRLLIRHRRLLPCFDGFDEMATRIDASELAGLLSGLLLVARGGGKVLVSSRTHYFPTSGHLQSAVAEALTRSLGQAAGLQRIVLQPFSDAQVQSLVHRVLGAKAEEALSRMARIYDLQDLVHRPLLLGMVLKTLDEFDPGTRVGRADLYGQYLQRWLAQTLRPRDSAAPLEEELFDGAQKEAFAEALAEQLWRSGEPSCSWEQLQGTVVVQLREVLLKLSAVPLGAALLEIQGGAFFVHEGEDRYRFAHKSFLEYFLARALVRTLPERTEEALSTSPLTQEVAAFVGEILARQEEPKTARAVRAVQRFLARASHAEAAANALRLLRGLARWAGDEAGWVPEGARLQGAMLAREDLRNLSLVGAHLEGAVLSGADLSGANLTGAKLERARLSGARLSATNLVGVEARWADFTQAEADRVDLQRADLRDATLRQSMWTRCRWAGARWEKADFTRAGGAGGRTSQQQPLAWSELEAALVTGHVGAVSAVAWHPEGGRLASASGDGTVRVWEEGSETWGVLFAAVGDMFLTCTRGGFFIARVDVPERIQLALPCEGATLATKFYLPLAGLREHLENPDKVAAALAGNLSEGDAWAGVDHLFFGQDTPWQGVPGNPEPAPTGERRPNPFRPGPALIDNPHLPGREAVLEDLLALVENRSPAILRGPRRAGKTSILHSLSRRLAAPYRVRHVTLEARNIVTADDLARVLEPSLTEDATPAATLRARLREEGSAVLLLDEIAHLLSADATVFAWLRAVGQESTSVVLVGSHWDWVQVVARAALAPGSSFGNDVTPVTLGPLAEGDALRFLEMTAPPDVPLPAMGVGRWVVDRCGTWPFYLQVMGHALVQAARSGNRRAWVERAGVTELYEGKLLVDRDAGYFRTRWAELPPRAREVLWRLRDSAEEKLPEMRSLAPAERKVLRDTGLTDHLGRWVEDLPFYDWLRRIADEDLGGH